MSSWHQWKKWWNRTPPTPEEHGIRVKWDHMIGSGKPILCLRTEEELAQYLCFPSWYQEQKYLSLKGEFSEGVAYPSQLTHLFIEVNDLTNFAPFPESLLVGRLNRVNQGAVWLPEKMITLTLSYCHSPSLLASPWPSHLQYLTLNQVTLSYFPSLSHCVQLKQLTLIQVELESPENPLDFPPHLQEITVRCGNWSSLGPWPATLQKLELRDLMVMGIFPLPLQLTKLMIKEVPLLQLHLEKESSQWPISLKQLELKDLLVTEIPQFHPASQYEYLFLLDLDLKSLPVFPREVRQLELGLPSLTHLGPLPRRGKILYWNLPGITDGPVWPEGLHNLNLRSYLPEIPPLPSTCEILTLRICSRIKRLPYFPDRLGNEKEDGLIGVISLRVDGSEFQVWEYCWWDQEVDLEQVNLEHLGKWQAEAKELQQHLDPWINWKAISPFPKNLHSEFRLVNTYWNQVIDLKDRIRFQLAEPLQVTL